MANNIKNKESNLTPYQQELIETATKILDYKKPAEANVVSILYKNPEIFYSYDSLSLDDFHHNEWRVFFEILKSIVVEEKIQKVTEVEIGLYLEKHSKLKEKYNEYGGYSSIQECFNYVKEENFNAYVSELKKWNTVLRLVKQGFPVKDKLSSFADMSLNEIYDYYEAQVNHTFINADIEIKSYDLSDGIYECIDELDKGANIGLPLYDMPILNHMLGGFKLGDMNLIGGITNSGKSTICRSLILPSIIMHNDKIVVMLNEESCSKLQFEMLVWVANNILKKDLQKYQVRDGKFTEEIKAILIEAADWLSKYKKDKTITIVPIPTYTTSLAIKIIKKYAALGINRFIIDTFKEDSGAVSAITWLQLKQNATNLYDVIKPEVNNLSLVLTYQLGKQTTRQRFLGLDSLGNSKGVSDVCSECILLRQIYDDEYPNKKNALSVYRLEGKEGKTKIPVSLDENKNYQILFIGKTRSGGKNDQIVIETDFSRNIIKEVGITRVNMDFNS